jgi:hypothetical protein
MRRSNEALPRSRSTARAIVSATRQNLGSILYPPATVLQLNERETSCFDQFGCKMIGMTTALNSSKAGPTLNVPLRVTAKKQRPLLRSRRK